MWVSEFVGERVCGRVSLWVREFVCDGVCEDLSNFQLPLLESRKSRVPLQERESEFVGQFVVEEREAKFVGEFIACPPARKRVRVRA